MVSPWLSPWVSYGFLWFSPWQLHLPSTMATPPQEATPKGAWAALVALFGWWSRPARVWAFSGEKTMGKPWGTGENHRKTCWKGDSSDLELIYRKSLPTSPISRWFLLGTEHTILYLMGLHHFVAENAIRQTDALEEWHLPLSCWVDLRWLDVLSLPQRAVYILLHVYVHYTIVYRIYSMFIYYTSTYIAIYI